MAQTVGIINGTLMGVYVGATLILKGKSTKFSMKMATRETTNKDTSGYKTVLGGLMSWDGSGDFLFAEDSAYGYRDLKTALEARAAVTVMWSSGVAGNYKHSGSAFITALDMDMPMEDNVTFSVSFEGSGALTTALLT